MPTPSSDQLLGPPSPEGFTTCPDDTLHYSRSERQETENARTENQDDVQGVDAPALEATNPNAQAASRQHTEPIGAAEHPSEESSSRTTTVSPMPFNTNEPSINSPISVSSYDGNPASPNSAKNAPSHLSAQQRHRGSEKNRSVSPEVPRSQHHQIGRSCSPSMGYDYPALRAYPTLPSSFLRAGTRFHGTQKSESQVYDVQVEIKHVDMKEWYLCGYLRIQGLTEDHPTLTTYFEGEIIGSKYGFNTQHDDWGASPKVDFNHWSKFDPFTEYIKHITDHPATVQSVCQSENIFMRWKEHFLVPDHRIRTILGASFEGFYYICFNQIEGKVSGIYFHSRSERFQSLELKHIRDRGCFSATEFR